MCTPSVWVFGNSIRWLLSKKGLPNVTRSLGRRANTLCAGDSEDRPVVTMLCGCGIGKPKGTTGASGPTGNPRRPDPEGASSTGQGECRNGVSSCTTTSEYNSNMRCTNQDADGGSARRVSSGCDSRSYQCHVLETMTPTEWPLDRRRSQIVCKEHRSRAAPTEPPWRGCSHATYTGGARSNASCGAATVVAIR